MGAWNDAIIIDIGVLCEQNRLLSDSRALVGSNKRDFYYRQKPWTWHDILGIEACVNAESWTESRAPSCIF